MEGSKVLHNIMYKNIPHAREKRGGRNTKNSLTGERKRLMKA